MLAILSVLGPFQHNKSVVRWIFKKLKLVGIYIYIYIYINILTTILLGYFLQSVQLEKTLKTFGVGKQSSKVGSHLLFCLQFLPRNFTQKIAGCDWKFVLEK